MALPEWFRLFTLELLAFNSATLGVRLLNAFNLASLEVMLVNGASALNALVGPTVSPTRALNSGSEIPSLSNKNVAV